ncbi:hypothetical protein TNCV_1701831, partial [Trichonephila clavipes]
CQVINSQFGLAIHQNDHQARRRFVEWAQNEIAVVPDFLKRILFSNEAHFWLNGYVNKQNCHIWSEANPQVYVETPLHPEKLTVWCLYGLVESLVRTSSKTMKATTLQSMVIARLFLWGYVKSLIFADKPQTLDHLEDNIRRVIADIRPQMLRKKSSKIGRPDWTTSGASRGSHMPEIIFKIPTENSLAVLNHKILEANSQVQNVKLGGHQTCLSINRLWHELCVTCCAVLLEPQLLDIMIVQFRNEKVSNHGSIPITIDCNVVAFIVFEEGFPPAHKAHQTVSFSGCNGVSTYTCGLASSNAAVLFVDVAIQPEVRFIAKQNSAYENREQRQSRFGPIRRIYALLDDRFDELPNQTENKSLDS